MEHFTKEMLEDLRSHQLIPKSTRCCYIGYDGAHYFSDPAEMLAEFHKFEAEQIAKSEMEWEAIKNRSWFGRFCDQTNSYF